MFNACRAAPKRVVYADGEEERVLRAVQVVLEDGLAIPTVIGRPAVIEARLKRSACPLKWARIFRL